MMDFVRQLIQRHRKSGILVDTNILLLKFVGDFMPRLIPEFRRTKTFTIDDYKILKLLLKQFERLITTPHILAEVNSFAGKIDEARRDGLFRVFAAGIQVMSESTLPSRTLAVDPAFLKFGLTDTAIESAAQAGLLVLTDDFKLSGYLKTLQIDVLNFNHLRMGYSR